MNTITETLTVSVGENYDVIVCGGGPSGTAAAISAARGGAKVLLCEKTESLGGMWTSGLVNPLFDYENKGGILRELVERIRSAGQWGGFWDKSFNYEYMKNALEEMCLSAGVNVLYDTRAVGVKKEGNKVCGITVENIEGRTYYSCKAAVDATADASVSVLAGAETLIGEDGFADCQAMTLMFLVGNVPKKYRDGLMFIDLLDAAYKKEGRGRTPPFSKPCLIPIPGTNMAVIQHTHVRGKNPLSAKERTDAVIEGRRQVIETVEVLKNYNRDFRDLFLISAAPEIGVRESRRIVGDYTITEKDLTEGTMAEDSVTVACYPVDIHHNDSDKQYGQAVRPYGIPYRALLPRGIEGLLTVGRCISGTHVAMSSYRVTGDCFAMGEAAGEAAAWACRENRSLREFRVSHII